MDNIEVASKCFDNRSKLLIGFKKITYHLIFDVKFASARNYRYLGGGHLTNVPSSKSYSIVVSRNSVGIIFLIAALNYLDVKMCDIVNSYLNVETRERLWFVSIS